MYHNNIVDTLKIHLCPLHIEHVLRLPGAVNPDLLRFASLRITLTVPEVVGTCYRICVGSFVIYLTSAMSAIDTKRL